MRVIDARLARLLLWYVTLAARLSVNIIPFRVPFIWNGYDQMVEQFVLRVVFDCFCCIRTGNLLNHLFWWQCGARWCDYLTLTTVLNLLSPRLLLHLLRLPLLYMILRGHLSFQYWWAWNDLSLMQEGTSARSYSFCLIARAILAWHLLCAGKGRFCAISCSCALQPLDLWRELIVRCHWYVCCFLLLLAATLTLLATVFEINL